MHTTQKIRIGTRSSRLATWQATYVQSLLATYGVDSELVFVKTEGDIDFVTPLYELGVQGVFTRNLDAAVLAGTVDIAVHSMKDVPIQMAEGIVEAAVLKRGSWKDILVPRSGSAFLSQHQYSAVIATCSVRRRAQWLHRFPFHEIVSIRGNVDSRLDTLSQSKWDGAIFAAAGLERIGMRPFDAVDLDWMLPAPAQGAILVVARKDDYEVLSNCRMLHDEDTGLCAVTERQFLRGFLGGCSVPVSALAVADDESIHFKGNIFSPDGRNKFEIEERVERKKCPEIGFEFAERLIQKGAWELLK